jgi:hypothetical protein
VLVKTAGGRQAKWKNCDKVWDLHQNEPAFAKYVQAEVVKMLAAKDAAPARTSNTRQKKGGR